MTENIGPNLRLAYWSDVFTVLSVELLPKRYKGVRVWRLALFCNGRHAVAALHERRIPGEWTPQPGEKIRAALRIGIGKGANCLHVICIALA
jgi:hypothetical protein